MIDKFITIKNLGRFKDYHEVVGEEIKLGKFTIIYSDNGMGKTTLCSIFHSLKSNDPIPILQRKSLNSLGKPSIDLVIDGENYLFENGTWTNNYPNIEIFDSKFVNDNVFTGDEITNEHGANLLEFALGEEAVKLSKEIESNKKLLNGLDKDIKEKENIILQGLKSKIDINAFINQNEIKDIKSKIETKKKEILASEDYDLIAKKEPLIQIEIPDIQIENIKRVLFSNLDSVSGNIEAKFKDHLVNHKMENDGESWVFQGLGYNIAQTCPFCGQNIDTAEMIKIYKTILSEEYKQHKENIGNNLAELKKTFSDGNQLIESVLKNNELETFWSKYININSKRIDTDQLSQVISCLRDKLVGFFEKKLASPLEPEKVTEEVDVMYSNYTSIKEDVYNYTKEIGKINQLIEARKISSKGNNIITLQQELNYLFDNQYRYDDIIKNLINDYKSLLVNRNELKTKNDALRSLVDEKLSNIEKYRIKINYYLKVFCTEFEIDEFNRNSRTTKPVLNFNIKINNCMPFDPRNAKKDDYLSPRLGTTLSEGDKSSLAFAFFLARVDINTNNIEKIFIIDDPVTSMDCKRREFTEAKMYDIKRNSKQLIILSHDELFLKKLVPQNKKDFVALAITGYPSSMINNYDEKYFCISSSIMDIEELSKFMDNQNPKPEEALSVCRCIRPTLENYFRTKYESILKQNDDFSGIINQIRTAQSNSPLYEWIEKVSLLEGINIFSREFMHDLKYPTVSLIPKAKVNVKHVIAILSDTY